MPKNPLHILLSRRPILQYYKPKLLIKMQPRNLCPKPIRRGAPQSPRQLDTTFIEIIGHHPKPYPSVIVDVGFLRVNRVAYWLLAGVKVGESAGVPGPFAIRMTAVAMIVELDHYPVWIRIPDAEVVGVR